MGGTIVVVNMTTCTRIIRAVVATFYVEISGRRIASVAWQTSGLKNISRVNKIPCYGKHRIIRQVTQLPIIKVIVWIITTLSCITLILAIIISIRNRK